MDGVAGVAAVPLQAGRQHGVVVNVGGTLKYWRHPQRSGLPISIPNNEPAFALETMLHRLRACLSSAKSRNPMSPVH